MILCVYENLNKVGKGSLPKSPFTMVAGAPVPSHKYILISHSPTSSLMLSEKIMRKCMCRHLLPWLAHGGRLQWPRSTAAAGPRRSDRVQAAEEQDKYDFYDLAQGSSETLLLL